LKAKLQYGKNPRAGRVPTVGTLVRGCPETIIHPSNARNLNIYLLGISGQLQKRLDGMYFTRNIGYVAVGYLASLVLAMVMALTASGRAYHRNYFF